MSVCMYNEYILRDSKKNTTVFMFTQVNDLCKYCTWEIFGVGKIGKFGALYQYFTCQLFLLVI